jgi:Zn-dependent peptidase ImmA (M78 family)
MKRDFGTLEERLADDVLSTHWSGTIPVEPEVIAKSMGAQVLQQDSAESGSLEIHEEDVFIYVRQQDPAARQRFTIAHEIGHWVLGHGNSFRDPAANFSSSSGMLVERQANRFAACLLMPRDPVIELATQGKWNTEDMARIFRVSRSAMEYRLKNLDLIS